MEGGASRTEVRGYDRTGAITGVAVSDSPARSEMVTFEDVARDQLAALYGLARRLADNDADAEDLVQEGLLRAYRSFDSLEDVVAAPRWFRVILTNVWRDRIRAKMRSTREVAIEDIEDFSLYRTLIEEDPSPYSDTMHLDFLGSFSEDDVHQVLRGLPHLYRAPLVLRYIEGFDTREVAALLDVPVGTALARLHRGRKQFERRLWDYASNVKAPEGPTAGGAR